MRLTSVAISTSDTDEQISFSVMDQDPDARYLTRAIVGIDAEEIVRKYIGRGLQTGKKFYEFVLTPRDIVIRASLNPKHSVNEDVQEIRDDVYRLISSNLSGELTLLFKSGSIIVSTIVGYVSKMEVAYTSKTPELQITVTCDNPIFKTHNPFEATTEELTSTNPIEVTDDVCTKPHGFNFRVKFTAVTTTFVVQDAASNPDWIFQVTPATSFQVDDELYISSEHGAKRVLWDKDVGADVELMDKVVAGSIWPQIFHGKNTFYFPQIANFDWVDFRFYPEFWGL